MAIIYTIQIAQHRQARQYEATLLDTTVKSGIGLFAPTWEMVMAYKEGRITEKEYTDQYRQRINETYRHYPDQWEHYLQIPSIALGCYCRPGEFCHRHLLKRALYNAHIRQGREVQLAGEITPNGVEYHEPLDQRIARYLGV